MMWFHVMHDDVISAYYSLNYSQFCNTSAFHYASYHIILEYEYSATYLKSHQNHVIEIALIVNLYEEAEVQKQSSYMICLCIKSSSSIDWQCRL